MKVSEWKTYRTRFLVKAKQLDSSLSFTDHLGRQHCGRRGDYLVESYDGVLSIAPRRIFEDIYVAMSGSQEIGDAPLPALSLSKSLPAFARHGKSEDGESCAVNDNAFAPGNIRPLDLPTVQVEPLAMQRIKPVFPYAPRDSARSSSNVARTRRKSPMSVPSTATRPRLM